ncbi:methyltransferase, FkbM family [compost metagenome]
MLIMKRIKNLIKHILFWILSNKKGYSDLRVLNGPAKGTLLRLDLRKEGSYFLGNYDKWIFDRIDFAKYVRPGMIIWDCGAYVGYYTAVFRKIIKNHGEIYAFEASTKAYSNLKEIPGLNNWDNVYILHTAVGPENTTINFSNNLGGSNGPVGLEKIHNDQIDIINVECHGVDEIVKIGMAKEPDFIKFDLETAEIYALNNGDNLFRNKRPIILLEIHGEKAFKVAGDFLIRYNYRAAYVGDFPNPKSWHNNYQELQTLNFIPHMIMCIPK